jgi:hypothetical protein
MASPIGRRSPVIFRVAGEVYVLALARHLPTLRHSAALERVEIGGLRLRRLLESLVASEWGARGVAALLDAPNLRRERGTWVRETVAALLLLLARGRLVLLRDSYSPVSDNSPLPETPPLVPPGPHPPVEPPEPIVDKSPPGSSPRRSPT